MARCITYIDLNMVRAGAVHHPREWEASGYREIQNPPARYRAIDYSALMGLLGIPDLQRLQRIHRSWIEEALKAEQSVRDERWSRSLAIGSQAFVAHFQANLGISAIHRTIEKHGNVLAPKSTGQRPGCLPDARPQRRTRPALPDGVVAAGQVGLHAGYRGSRAYPHEQAEQNVRDANAFLPAEQMLVNEMMVRAPEEDTYA